MVFSKEEQKARKKEYENRPEVKSKTKIRKSGSEYKEKLKIYQNSPRYKALQKTRRSTLDYRVKENLRCSTLEYKAKKKIYHNLPEVKARKKLKQLIITNENKKRKNIKSAMITMFDVVTYEVKIRKKIKRNEKQIKKIIEVNNSKPSFPIISKENIDLNPVTSEFLK